MGNMQNIAKEISTTERKPEIEKISKIQRTIRRCLYPNNAEQRKEGKGIHSGANRHIYPFRDVQASNVKESVYARKGTQPGKLHISENTERI